MMKIYAAYNVNEERMLSSSGGIFSVLASLFDVVYGVAMDEKCKYAVFKRVTKDISRLRGSKYIQAKVGDTFKQVKKDLLDGNNVLFTGTACQVNGLYSFLGRKYDNLTTVDIVCEGVPSQILWNKFINNKSVQHISFRAKDMGWIDYGMKINGQFIPKEKNAYMKLYVSNIALRPSCYECVCKQTKKSDITLGDFWGIDNLAPEINDNKGISLVIVRTKEGEKIFDQMKETLVFKEVNYEDAVACNPAEYSSFKRPENREQFFKDMERMSFYDLYKKYTRVPLWQKTARKAKRLIKKMLRKNRLWLAGYF